MATAEQIKSLIKSHFSDQQEQFCTIALQLAAHEARQGHQSLAKILPPFGDNEPELYGAIVKQCISKEEIQAPKQIHIGCMAHP
jgi:hypothetical protein